MVPAVHLQTVLVRDLAPFVWSLARRKRKPAGSQTARHARTDVRLKNSAQQKKNAKIGPVVLVLTVLGSLTRSPARKRREEDSPARLSLSVPVERMSSVLVMISALSQ
jgi:hypothetical protein